MSDQELVDQLSDVWASILELGATLTEAEWKQPSLLPGWSNQDVVAHMLWSECALLGWPVPDHVAPPMEHVRTEFGAFIENGVDSYRAQAGIEVLAQFAAVAEARIDALRALDADGFGGPVTFPIGDGTVRGVLPFRIFDCWIHEQDIRIALDRPGGWETSAVDLVFDRLFSSMGKVVAKHVGAPEGTVVVWRVGGARHAIEVRDGRGRSVDAPDTPAVVLVFEPEVFLMLTAGRGNPDALIPLVRVEGDASLGMRVLERMNVLF
jgi:uncharacterized protein (TIGR03083 family)